MSLSRKRSTKNPKLTIASTRFHSQQCPKLQNSKHNWIRRNNSSNVSSLLSFFTSDSEESEEEQPRRLIYSKTPTPEPIKTFCRSCYCKSRPVTPATPCGCKKSDAVPCCGSKKCEIVSPRCKNSEAVISSRCRNSGEVESKFENLRRKARSIQSQKLENSYCPKSQNFSSTVCTKITSHPCKFTPSRRNYENLTSNYFLKEKCTQSKSLSEELLGFREDNFFECRKTSVQTPPPHKCQHIFSLDKNLSAKPRNPDVYGVSRCSTCSRPISATSLQYLPPKSKSGSKTSTSEDKVSVSVSNEEEDLVFEVDREVIEEPREKIAPKKVVRKGARPANSVALRFQKGIY